MIFGSKTGYGKVDLILPPSYLQVCNKFDVKAPAKKLINIATVLGVAMRLRARPSPSKTQSFRECAGFIEENRGGARVRLRKKR
jgi:hypothetical protein